MDPVKSYVKKFMSESAEQDPTEVEMNKIRDLIDREQGSEFSVHVEHEEEVEDSIDPTDGSLKSHMEYVDADGYLLIEKQEDNTWSWSAVISDAMSSLDLDDSGKGFASLDDCLKEVKSYISSFDDFTVEGLA